MDKAQAARWLERYVEAWKTYDRGPIEELFTEDVEYRYHPYDEEPVRGRDAVVNSWFENRDEPNSYEAHYEPIAVDGNRVVATGTSTYLEPDGSVKRVYDNCFLMRFADSGRCSQFTEFYMERPRSTVSS